jgi:hypothetical protein
MTYKITLSSNEQRLATFIAKMRYANARSNNVKDLKMGDQSNEQTDLEGFGAELAFCKLMNIYPDLETENYPSYDCMDCNGITYDVKSTIYPNGHLLATLKKKNNPPDKYVLCVGEFPEYKIVGEIGADEFLQDSNIGNLGKGPGFMLTQAELHPIRVSVINIKERYGITNRQKDKT